MSNIKRKPNNQKPIDKDGLAHGEWLYYYFNGNLMYRQNWVHGVMHGLQEGYDYDGTLCYRGNLNMGKKIVYWYNYRTNKKYNIWLI